MQLPRLGLGRPTLAGSAVLRTVVVMVALVAMVLVPAACGGDDDDASGERVTLTLPSWWWGEPGNKDWLEAVVTDFERENPNIRVRRENVSFDDYGDRALAQISANRAPDVLHLTNMNMGDFLRVNGLADLNDFIEDSDISEDTFIPAQFEAPLTTDGSTHGVIHSVANYIPFYNEEILSRAGYDEFPDNPEDFFRLIEESANPPKQFGYAAMVAPGAPSELFIDASIWVFANGGDWARNGEPSINAPENVEAIEQLKRTVASEVMPRGVDKATYRQMWWEGKVAVIFDGSWMKGFAETESPDVAEQLQTALLPWASRRAATVYQIWAVADGSEHKEEAFKLIEHMQSDEWQEKMVTDTKNISPRINAAPEDFLQENPWFEPFQVTAEQHGVSVIQEGLELHAGEVVDAVAEQVEQVLYRDVPAEEALSAAQQRVEEIVAQG